MIDKVEYINAWDEVKDSAMVTIGKEGGKTPGDGWKKTMLLAEHSPIRLIKLIWRWKGLKSWVSVHYVRHHIGITHFVSTQRSDRTGIQRDKLPQDQPVNHKAEANAQALINISRKRDCNMAAPETRAAWAEVHEIVKKVDPVLESVMVPECIYRGFCPEAAKNCCGYVHTSAYRKRLEAYRQHE